MGSEAVWIPLALAAASAGGNVINEQNTQNRQAAGVEQGIAAQASKQHEADAAVNDQVQQLGQSSPEQARAQAADAFVTQLRRTRAQAQGGGTEGAVSDRYTSGTTQAQQDVSGYGDKVANLMARINAPQIQRQAEGQSVNRLGQSLGTIGRAANGEDFLTQLRNRSITPNPWVTAGSQLLGAGASAAAANGGGTAAPKTKPAAYAGDYNLTGATRGFA